MAVHFVTYLIKQTNQTMSQTWRDRFSGNFAKSPFKLLKTLFKDALCVA